jgi:drug/metabolite transporter (DMT)-like permease
LSSLPTLAMLAAVFLWSSATPASKFVLLEVPPAEFVMLRLSLAAVALWLVVLTLRPDVRLRNVGWRPLAMGLLEPGLVTVLIAIGLTMTSPVSGSVFWGLMPLLMPLLARVVLGEIIVASGVLASAFNGLIARRNALAGANPLVTTSWQLTSACAVAALLLLIMPASRTVDANPQSIGVLVYLGLVVSAGVYILSNYAMRHLPVGRISLLGCLTAPLGAMLSALFLGTHVSALDVFAVGLVIVAVALPGIVKRRSLPEDMP